MYSVTLAFDLDLVLDLDMSKMYLMTFDLWPWPWLDLDLSKMINGLRPRFWPRYDTWRPWPWPWPVNFKVYFYAQNRKLYNGTGNLFLLLVYIIRHDFLSECKIFPILFFSFFLFLKSVFPFFLFLYIIQQLYLGAKFFSSCNLCLQYGFFANSIPCKFHFLQISFFSKFYFLHYLLLANFALRQNQQLFYRFFSGKFYSLQSEVTPFLLRVSFLILCFFHFSIFVFLFLYFVFFGFYFLLLFY